MSARNARLQALQHALSQRILILDGGMGTMIQSYKLEESDYQGERFADWPSDVKGNNDLLLLSRPDVIQAIEKPISMPAPTFWKPTPSMLPGSPKPTTAWKNWSTS